mgnify:CR=1 FL=1
MLVFVATFVSLASAEGEGKSISNTLDARTVGYATITRELSKIISNFVAE